MTGRKATIGWHVLLTLLGVEAALPLSWQLSGVRFDGREWFEPVTALLEIVPLVTILVALRLGWIERRPEVVRWIVGLALVGPVLFAVSRLTPGSSPLFGFSTIVATPASVAVVAGLVGGLARQAGRGSLLFVAGAVLGFAVPARVMISLGIGRLGASLPEENIVAASFVAVVVLVCILLPALGAGVFLGHRIRVRSVSRAID